MSIEQTIEVIQTALADIDSDDAKVSGAILQKLLNLVEAVMEENRGLKAQIQELKDEINRLKGEQGSIKRSKRTQKDDSATTNNTAAENPQNDSEKTNPMGKEGKQEQPWNKGSKVDEIEIDHEQTIAFDPTELPSDAIFKGHRTIIVQGIKISRDNVAYHLQRYYSPSEKKTYEAKPPADVNGSFNAQLKTWILYLTHQCRVTQSKIHQILTDLGILISKGQLSNILTKGHESFHQEKSEIVTAAIAAGSYHHIDDTTAKVSGQSQYFSVLCNEHYSAFFTHANKDRLSVLKILIQSAELCYSLNDQTLEYLQHKQVPAHVMAALERCDFDQEQDESSFKEMIQQACPKIKERYLDILCEAAAVSYYQNKHCDEKIKILISDAAKQFVGITQVNALCWIHEERHYKKLIPIFKVHQQQVEEFRGRIWNYYRKLQKYKDNPNRISKEHLEEQFDQLFSTQTGYDALDKRIEMTHTRKNGLLAVLEHPEIPLHNNPAELAVREYVVRRKIISQTRSEEGTKCLETFLSLKDTCGKLAVNFFAYLHDRVSKANKMPSLASIIN